MQALPPTPRLVELRCLRRMQFETPWLASNSFAFTIEQSNKCISNVSVSAYVRVGVVKTSALCNGGDVSHQFVPMNWPTSLRENSFTLLFY